MKFQIQMIYKRFKFNFFGCDNSKRPRLVSATSREIIGPEFSNEPVVVMKKLDYSGRVELEKFGTAVDDVVNI
jgi:hypothetical protein